MEYTQRTVTSKAGLSQEEALASLQDHPLFKPGTRIASIRRRNNVWVAALLEPKVAEFPPADDSEDEAPEPKSEEPKEDEAEDKGGEDDGESGPPSNDGPPSKGKDSEKAEVKELLDLVHKICDALGIAPSPDPMGGPDDLGAGPDGPMPPGPGPDGPPPPDAGGPPAHQEIIHRTKIKPGEAPPGVTPLGAPSFSHTKQANPSPTMGPQTMGDMGGTAEKCSHCGSPMPDGSCAMCQQQNIVGQASTFVASCHDPKGTMKMAAAKSELESLYASQGYSVKQIQRQGEYIRGLLSKR